MNLVDYGRIVLRRGWIIILVAIIGAASAFILSRQQPAIVRATKVMLIQPARVDNGLTIATTSLLNPLVAYLNSTYRAQEVIDNLQLDMTSPDLLGMVDISAVRDNMTIQIDVNMADCAIANQVAEQWGNLLIQYRIQQNQTALQESRVDAVAQDASKCPTSQSPNIPINTAAGALFGLILGVIIVFVLEYLESSIVHRREDIERALELPVLASVPNLE